MSDFRLKVFVSAAKHLSFTKASEELFISQPAITKHIQELETQYKSRLFERMGHTITLTTAGTLLLKHCESILELYERLDYEMNLLHNEYTGELRLGASTTIAQYVLSPFLAQFNQKFPLITLSLMNGNSVDIEKALQERHIDLGLVEGPNHLLNLRYTPFLDDELVAVVSTKSALAKMDTISLQQLQQIPLILRENGSGTLEIFKNALRLHGLKTSDLTIKMQLGSTESIKRFLEHTDCMGIVSIRSIDRELYAGTFKVLEIDDLPMPRHFSFIQRQGQEIALSEFFIQFISNYKKTL